MKVKRIALLILSILALIVSVSWWLEDQGFESVLAFIAGAAGLIQFFIEREHTDAPAETLDQRNRRLMLSHVENSWVKGVLEKSLHGVALLEMGIKEDPTAVSYPWTIRKQSTKEILPTGKPILEIFQDVGSERSLLILGAPGSGKTTMLLQLARQLIARARQDETEPIPVVLNLASWTPKQPLTGWLAEQLNIVYSVPKETASEWVHENRMILLLDGLDEVEEVRRAKCVEALNHFRKEHGLTSLVVCSRIEEYVTIEAKLLFEGAITLQPLTTEQINDFLDRFGEKRAVIKQLLSKDEAFQALADTPLMLDIMVLAYENRKVAEGVGYHGIEEDHQRLFDTYIAQMFNRVTRSTPPFTKSQTVQYLARLARIMVQNNIVTCQIESLQTLWLDNNLHRYQYRLFVLLLLGLIVMFWAAVVAVSIGALFGQLMIGLTTGLLVGLGVLLILYGQVFIVGIKNLDNITPMMGEKLEWTWKDIRRMFPMVFCGDGCLIMILLTFGVVFAMISPEIQESIIMIVDHIGLRDIVISVLVITLLWGALSFLFGIRVSPEIEETTYPGQGIARTRNNALILLTSMLASGGIASTLALGVLGRQQNDINALLVKGIVGILIFWLPLILRSGPSKLIFHYSLRFILASNKLLPWNLISFLDYAVDLLFLRRVGGSYIFVHRLLMEHFAEMDV